MLKRTYVIFVVGLVLVGALFIYGCGSAASSSGGGGSSSTPRVYTGIDRSSGSNLMFTVSDGTFTMTIESGNNAGVYISGTYRTLASGVQSAEVTVTSNPTAIATHELANVIEFPNVVMLVSFLSGKDIIVCPAKSTDPANYTSSSAIIIPWDNWWGVTPGPLAYATIEMSGTSPNITFDIYAYKLNGTGVLSSKSGYSFSDGKYYKNDTNPTIYMTPSGAFVANISSNETGGFAGGKRATVTTTEVLSHTYKGVLNIIDTTVDSIDSSEVKAIYVKQRGTESKFNVYEYNNLDSSTYSGPIATFEVYAQNSDKVFPGIIYSVASPGTSPAFMQATALNGKYLLYGIATAENGCPFNFMVYQE